MQQTLATPGAEIIVTRLRRLVTIWRATYIVQMILLLLLAISVGLALSLPGVLAMLLRSALGAQLLIPGILIPLLLLDPVAAYVELRMGRQLRVQRTGLRKVLTVLYLVPGVMLFRRTLQLLMLGLLGSVILLALVVWFVGMLANSVLMRVSAPAGAVFGRGVDAVDRLLSGLYAEFRSTLREIALSPAHKIDNEEHIVVPLLAAQLEEKSASPK